MSLRLSTEEIIRVIDSGEGPEPWLNLIEDVTLATCHERIGAELRTAARYLERRFPGRTWGWQDFDKLLSDHIFTRWSATMETPETDTVEYEPLDDGHGNLVIRGVSTVADVLR